MKRRVLIVLATVPIVGVLATGSARSQATGTIVISEEITEHRIGDPTPETIIDGARVSDLVRVEGVRVDGATLHGRIVNESRTELTDVRLLVRHAFQWDDEFHPGEDNPGRARVLVLEGAIPPGRTLEFARPIAPLPMRNDGTFTTDVKVLGFTQVGAADDGPPASVVGRR